MTSLPDSDLIKSVANGDQNALSILIERWELPIKAFVYRMIQDANWVDELTQETFVKVYLNADRFRANQAIKPWIFSIAANLCKNHFRWKSRRPVEAWSIDTRNDWDLATKSKDSNPIQLFEDRETAQTVKSAIASLPEKYRLVIVLRYYEDMSYQDIAETIGCSRKGADTRLERAKKLLKKKLSA